MSKKVAELTQVVHMLFTRNHEKEVEIEALKDAYECEITIVIEDARNRIVKLENKVLELERKLERERNKQYATVKEVVAQESSDKDDEWRRKLVAVEKALNDEKVETLHLRDLLINAQKDIEKLRQRLEDQVNSRTDEVQRREAELSKLKKQIIDLERIMNAKDMNVNETIKNLEKSNEQLEKECIEIQEILDETYQIKESLTSRVKQLESELRALKRDFHKKVSDVIQQNHIVRQRPTTPTQPQSSTEYNDELEKLRAEVKRYRLELQNRDTNFNRVFTEHQRLIVDHRAGIIGINSSQALSRPVSNTQISPVAVQGRERSFAYDIVHGFEETRRPISHLSSSSSSSKLPTLSADQRARLTKLLKPRPLPKEMLYSK